MADEVIDYKPDGTIRLISGTTQLRLRRPKNGARRELEELWQRTVETETEGKRRVDEMGVDDEDALKVAQKENRVEVHASIFDWWREVARMLDDRGGKFPDDDDEMPTWLLNVETITEAFSHWASVPWVPGHRPSVREAEAMGPMLDKLQQMVTLLPQATQGQTSSED